MELSKILVRCGALKHCESIKEVEFYLKKCPRFWEEYNYPHLIPPIEREHRWWRRKGLLVFVAWLSKLSASDLQDSPIVTALLGCDGSRPIVKKIAMFL